MKVHPTTLTLNSVFRKIGKLMARKRTEGAKEQEEQQNRIQCRTKVLKVSVLC